MPTPYESILASLDSIPWSGAPEVMPLRPLDRKSIEFFPGHKGHIGPEFPLGGVMVVGNNFSTIQGWSDYANSPDVDSTISTWKRLRLMIEASDVSAEAFWFTNYCHGAMEGKAESYNFPRRIIKALEFDRVFAECVSAMKPRLIVTLGLLASDLLKTDFGRERIDEREIGGHRIRLMAVVHPSAWTWRGKGFGDKEFAAEGVRIGTAAHEVL